MNTHKSMSLTNEKMNAELLNTLDFLVDKAYHIANMEIPKLSKWEKIGYMLAGFGLLAFIQWIIQTVLGRF